MSEKIYKAMKNTGALNIAVGIVTLVTGIASGILLIVSGANLLKKKEESCSETLNYEKIDERMEFRVIGVILFFLYLAVLTYFLFFSEKYGRTAEREFELQSDSVSGDPPFLELPGIPGA